MASKFSKETAASKAIAKGKVRTQADNLMLDEQATIQNRQPENQLIDNEATIVSMSQQQEPVPQHNMEDQTPQDAVNDMAYLLSSDETVSSHNMNQGGLNFHPQQQVQISLSQPVDGSGMPLLI